MLARNVIFYKLWKDEEVGRWWDGKKWNELNAEPGIDRFVNSKALESLFE